MSDKSFTGLQLPNIGSGQARNPDSGFARIYFKNDNLYAVLPNGSEKQISGIGLDDLNNVVLTSPASGNVLSFNGTNWVNSVPTGGSGGASVTVSATAPTSPADGDLWWDEDVGKLFIYYNDGDTTQWVEAVPAATTTGGAGGIALTDLSVTTATASEGGGLSYNNVNGVFTFTPPDLSSYLTSESNDLTASVTWANVPDANITQTSVTQHQAALSITESQISDFGTYATTASLATVATTGAYGDLSGAPTTVSSFTNDAGYITDYTVTQSDVTAHQAALSISESQITFTSSFIELSDISVGANAAASGSGGVEYDSATGIFTYTPPDLSSYLTSVPAEYLTQTEGDARYLQLTGGSLTGNLSLGDAIEARFGLGSGSGYDLRIYHNGTSYIENTTTHSLIFKNTSENYIVCQPNNAVTLYHNGAPKFSTASTGVSVTGNIAVTGTVDGRDLSVDGTKLDGIETGADVTDAGNVNPLIDAHLNTSTATSNQVLSWTGTDYDWVAQSGGGGGALGDLTDVTITSVADGDLIRYNGTAGEWQNTNLGLSVTPTLSGSSTIYFAQFVTITNWNSYDDPHIFAQVKNSGGTVVITNDNIGTDLANGTIFFGRPSSTGSYTLEVQVQDFGDLASEVATLSFTVSNASFRYWRITNFDYKTNGVILRELKFYTGAGQTGTAYPSNMTSNTAPSPYVASGVNAYSATYDYYTSFDGNTSTGYWNLSSPQSTDYVQIDMGSSITAVSILLNFNSSFSVNSCNVYGSNTGSFSGEEVNVLDFDANLPYTVISGNDVYELG